MRRSKLEIYEAILNTLAERPRTVDNIAYQCNMDILILNERLIFLQKNNLIEQNNCNQKTQYSLTRRGNAIYKTLTIAKRLERLQTADKTLDQAFQALPTVSENSKEKTSKTRSNENY